MPEPDRHWRTQARPSQNHRKTTDLWIQLAGPRSPSPQKTEEDPTQFEIPWKRHLTLSETVTSHLILSENVQRSHRMQATSRSRHLCVASSTGAIYPPTRGQPNSREFAAVRTS